MQTGTKSLLLGGHQFIIHPIIVAYCYIKLYGFPWNPCVWLAIILHDIGYFGQCYMDDESGKEHPWMAAKIFSWLYMYKTANFSLFHSRYMCESIGKPISKLGVADKMAVIYTPVSLYCDEELAEYMKQDGFSEVIPQWVKQWKYAVDYKCKQFIELNKDSAYDIQQY